MSRVITVRDIELPWLGSLITLALFENPDLTFEDFVREAQKFDEGNKYTAWNHVRHVRSPNEVLPATYYHTGLEGYPVGVWTSPEILERKIGFGADFLNGFARTYKYNGRMRRNLSGMMDCQHPKWSLSILKECDAFIGTTIARLKVLAVNTRDRQTIAVNAAFRADTYEWTRSLPKVSFSYNTEKHSATVSYAVCSTGAGDAVKPPFGREEEYLLALSRVCAAVNPLVRVLLRNIPERPFEMLSLSR